MKILITGSGGQVAYDLKKVFNQYELFAPTHTELSITDELAIENALTHFKPDFVINTAAYTQVDRAEQESELAYAVNAMGAKNLAMQCEKFRCPLLHLSTDYVFAGDVHRPYLETDATLPLNVYGKSKLQGEHWVTEYCEKSIILRVSGVFGFQGNNFVKTILRLARERDTLKIVSDQITSPTSAASIANAILKITENPTFGLFHFCSEEALSWHAFAEKIIALASAYEIFKVKEILAIPASDYPLPAKRPNYSVLNCEKFKKTFNLEQPDLTMELTDVLKTLFDA